MTFSLIVATRGRTEELVKLFESLLSQTLKTFEVIVVDQNEDDRLERIVASYRCAFPLIHLCVSPRGKAAANNAGIEVANSDVIAFPDDDCWYPPRLLAEVAHFLRLHPDSAAVTGRESASAVAPTNNRFDVESGEITKANVWRRHISFTMFFRRVIVGRLRFDENLGVGAGTRWGAGEDTDFLLRFIKAGNRVSYVSDLVVCHPDWGRGPVSESYYRKARSYGMGMGRLLRTHRFPAQIVLKYFIRPAGGAVLSALRGSPAAFRYYLAVFQGRFMGWMLSGQDRPA